MGNESGHDRERWNERHGKAAHLPAAPDGFVVKAYGRWVQPRFSDGGCALDVAGGRGRHAIWLAQRGWDVTLVDLSEVGLQRARAGAEERGVKLTLIHADMQSYDPGIERFDLVLVCYYLERTTLPRLAQALRPGGLMVYKTYTQADVRFSEHPEQYFLKHDELRSAFPGFEVLHYAEKVADRATAEMVAQKPASRG